jgi:hypothetical protein
MPRYDFNARTAMIITAFALSACSSDGSLAFGGGVGGGRASGSAGASGATTSDGGGAFASSGNVSDLLSLSGQGAGDLADNDAMQAAGDLADPLARVSVNDEAVVGADNGGAQALGVSALSAGQDQGDVATVGVLANGQVATANVNGEGQNGDNLIGAQANDDQIIGGQNDALGVNALSTTSQQGSIGTASVLNNGQIADAQLTAPQGSNGAVANTVNSVTNTLNSLTGGQ